MRFALMLTLCLTLAGCSLGAPKFDASSEESVRTSMERMTKGMSDKERVKLAGAMASLMVADPVTLALNAKDSTVNEVAVFKPLHGMTAKEIIAKAEAAKVPGAPSR